MARSLLISALLTATFCAFFARFVEVLTETLVVWHVTLLGGISGFFGRIFAHFIHGHGDPR